MSIECDRDFGCELICDICGETVDNFDEFYEAVDYKKEYGWKSKKIDGEWHDICPSCQEAK